MAEGYTKLFSDIVDSSIWDENAETCKVWVTLLALCNADGMVRGSIGWLAGKARVSQAACQVALSKFEASDPKSRTTDNDGQRIEALEDGWLILNYLIFRDRLSTNPKAVKTRERVRLHRERYHALRNINSVTPVHSDSVSASASESVSEVESVEVCISKTMNVGIPEDFTRYVYADWSSRAGKDAGGVLVAFLPYVTKRWVREQVEWKNGHHKGVVKTDTPPAQNRISQEKELDRIASELKNFAPNLSDYDEFSAKRLRMVKLRSRRKELQKILGVVA
jgi:hypothetical protein